MRGEAGLRLPSGSGELPNIVRMEVLFSILLAAHTEATGGRKMNTWKWARVEEGTPQMRACAATPESGSGADYPVERRFFAGRNLALHWPGDCKTTSGPQK